MHSRIGMGTGGHSTFGAPALPPEAAPPLEGSAGAGPAQPPDAANDSQVQPELQSPSLTQTTGTAWQLPVEEGAQSQPLSGGTGVALPLEPAPDPPAPGPEAPLQAQAVFTMQVKPAPQSASA